MLRAIFTVLGLCLAFPAWALDCKTPAPALPGDFVVTVSPATSWQPRGGQVKVTIESATQTVKEITVDACFRWSSAEGDFLSSPLVQLLEMAGDNPKKAVYAVTVPDLPMLETDWWDRLGGKFPAKDARSYEGWRTVPVADLKIIVGKPVGALAVVPRSVGITTLAGSAVITALATLIAIVLLYRWARQRQVPGSGLLLPIVTARDGYASLSQFQITLWSLLFGAGAVYVMSLSGSLIDIPTGALVLLGISGATVVGAKIKEANDAKQQPPAPTTSKATIRPGPVTLGTPAAVTDRGVTLTWTAPAPPAAPATPADAEVAVYIVRYATADFSDWKVANDAVSDTTFTVTGLRPETNYLFQVQAANAAGPGPTAQATARTTRPIVVNHTPTWSDLVGTAEHPGEIDVTRVQMLFFTLIAAAFVAIKLFNSYTIPDIPAGILVLMGISNGTYLSAKFAR